MRKISILFTLLLSFGISAQEVFVLQPVNIDPSDTQKFEMIEKTYATPMAQEAKEKGLIKDYSIKRG